ncbi:lipid-A-disaccharide synthase [Urbifossiella limnaea]|uniref:Lipid-A-disaccharide synthase n=1 Tax=Urbifossiella limnaea TaxID=2528023 RepID=A0A517XV80_9BACT|nr:lipid-A-disaccharide synthase [Urbifossiella limnaea]QDU21406.1 Glycosyl transferase [Urbifossiella limnaea]
MHLFLSAGEPSGDLHGANLVRALARHNPAVRVTGLGGPRMAAAGATVLYPLAKHAVMGFVRVLKHLRTFFRAARLAQRSWAADRPDAVVIIDCSGFNLPLAKRAHAAGIPVYYFMPPQVWAWRSGRVEKIRRWCAGVLTVLPFEDEWYRSRGVATHFVGHPYFDELAAQQPDAAYVAAERSGVGPIVGLLPGSRDQEVTANLRLLVGTARRVAAERPDARFRVAAFNDRHADVCRAAFAGLSLPVEVLVGRTPEVISMATACVAVSGSVSLELMARHVPSVVVYRMGRWTRKLVLKLVKVRWMSLVNLLAGEELYPENATDSDDPTPVAAPVLRWLNDEAARSEVVGRLRELTSREARPGACDRAAAYLLAAAGGRAAAA